jgi:hypothetical protein
VRRCQQRIADRQHVRWADRNAEKGSGIPLLSIHGAGGGYDQGLANAAGFVGAGFRIIAPSRFGYLGTPVPPDISPAAQADAHVVGRLGGGGAARLRVNGCRLHQY